MKLLNREATAAVIRLGYVGLPLALEIASAGFRVVGIDLEDREKSVELTSDAIKVRTASSFSPTTRL